MGNGTATSRGSGSTHALADEPLAARRTRRLPSTTARESGGAARWLAVLAAAARIRPMARTHEHALHGSLGSSFATHELCRMMSGALAVLFQGHPLEHVLADLSQTGRAEKPTHRTLCTRAAHAGLCGQIRRRPRCRVTRGPRVPRRSRPPNQPIQVRSDPSSFPQRLRSLRPRRSRSLGSRRCPRSASRRAGEPFGSRPTRRRGRAIDRAPAPAWARRGGRKPAPGTA
jgi:hypothetical protein